LGEVRFLLPHEMDEQSKAADQQSQEEYEDGEEEGL
jgi:hypothetical protein